MAGVGLSPLANCCQGTLHRFYWFKLPRQDLPGGLVVEKPPVSAGGTWVQSLGREALIFCSVAVLMHHSHRPCSLGPGSHSCGSRPTLEPARVGLQGVGATERLVPVLPREFQCLAIVNGVFFFIMSTNKWV